MDKFRRSDVQSAGRMDCHEKFGILLQDPSHNDLLLIAAGECTGRHFQRGRANVIELLKAFRFLLDRFLLEQMAPGIRLILNGLQEEVLLH